MSHPRPSLFVPQNAESPASFEIETGIFRAAQGLRAGQRDTFQATFAPMHYAPGYAYPLIVWLHGPGCDERQLLRIMPLVSMRNHVGVAPRGVAISTGPASGCPEPVIYGWPQDEQGLQQAEQRVFDAIETACSGYNIHPRRVFLAGFDCGGTLAFRLAMNHPYKFAGVISLGGPLPCGRAPLARLSEARQLAIFLAVGRRSQVYEESQVCENLRLLHTAGMSITLRAYPCGHEISPGMLSDVDAWIIEQVMSDKAKTDLATV
jgi:phospholipase/carboxylesterase